MGICVAWPAAQAQKSQPELDRAFQSATAHYETKEYAEAQKELEPLLARLPNSFEVNELMGLVYAAQGLDEKANRYLKAATRLNPNDPAARTNLAVNLVQLRKESLAEVEFKRAVELDSRALMLTTTSANSMFIQESSQRPFLNSRKPRVLIPPLTPTGTIWPWRSSKPARSIQRGACLAT